MWIRTNNFVDFDKEFLFHGFLKSTKSQALVGGHLRKNNLSRAGLSFVAYVILGSTND